MKNGNIYSKKTWLLSAGNAVWDEQGAWQAFCFPAWNSRDNVTAPGDFYVEDIHYRWFNGWLFSLPYTLRIQKCLLNFYSFKKYSVSVSSVSVIELGAWDTKINKSPCVLSPRSSMPPEEAKVDVRAWRREESVLATGWAWSLKMKIYYFILNGNII